MTTSIQPAGGGGGVGGGPSSKSLAYVIDTILDKGLVIDAYVRVSLVGIEIVTVDARVVVASVERTCVRGGGDRLEIRVKPKGLPVSSRGRPRASPSRKPRGL